MKNKDYILFIIGSLCVAFSFVVAYKDQDVAGFMYSFGYVLIAFFVGKGIYKYIKKRTTQSN